VFCPTTPGKAAMNADLGNYAANSGEAPFSVDPIAPVTAFFGLFRGLGLIPLLVLWFAPLAAAVRLASRRRDRASGDAKALAVITMLLSATAVAQFVVSAFGDGIDTAKHLNLSIYATALAIVTSIGCAVLVRTGRSGDGISIGGESSGETGSETDAAADAQSDLLVPRPASDTVAQDA